MRGTRVRTRNGIGRVGWSAVGAAAGLVVGVSGVAVAGSTSAPSPEIVACVGPDRVMRLPGRVASSPPASVTSDQAASVCSPTETQLTWGQVGPTGPRGQQGDAGVSGLEWVAGSQLTAADDEDAMSLACPEGKVPISGAYRFVRGESPGQGYPVSAAVRQWGSSYGDEPNEWSISYQNTLHYNIKLHMRVLCVLAS